MSIPIGGSNRSLAAVLRTNSIPKNKPFPRMSPITLRCFKFSKPARNFSPITRAFAGNARCKISSIVAKPAAQEIGPPSKVCPSTNPRFFVASPQTASAMCRRQIRADSGAYPPPMPFPDQIRSGVTPNVSAANMFPVRPMPVMISSKINKTFWRSQISRS